MASENISFDIRVDVSRFQAALWCCAYEAALLATKFYPSTTETTEGE